MFKDGDRYLVNGDRCVWSFSTALALGCVRTLITVFLVSDWGRAAVMFGLLELCLLTLMSEEVVLTPGFGFYSFGAIKIP